MFAQVGRGSLWEQIQGRFVGRRGKLVEMGTIVTLDPAPGSCRCQLRQRRTKINRLTFYREWRLVEEA